VAQVVEEGPDETVERGLESAPAPAPQVTNGGELEAKYYPAPSEKILMLVELRSKNRKLGLSCPEFGDLSTNSKMRNGCLDIRATAHLKGTGCIAGAIDRL
jgi:hypothetical protein